MGYHRLAVELKARNKRRKHPDNIDYQHLILDAIFALGKTENNFVWIEKPAILRMSDDILDFCYEFLRRKRKPRSVLELLTQLGMRNSA